MSVVYSCDRCGAIMEPEQALGYALVVAGFRLAIKPAAHLCVPCLVRLLQVAAEATTLAELVAGVR